MASETVTAANMAGECDRAAFSTALNSLSDRYRVRASGSVNMSRGGQARSFGTRPRSAAPVPGGALGRQVSVDGAGRAARDQQIASRAALDHAKIEHLHRAEFQA